VLAVQLDFELVDHEIDLHYFLLEALQHHQEVQLLRVSQQQFPVLTLCDFFYCAECQL
jgi:hypothetical protein